MRIGVNAAVIGAMEQQKRLEVIANNLANAHTPGFKKDDVHFSDFIYETSYTQMSEGPVYPTGSPLDVALHGDGYLSVRTGDEMLYTRAGNLTLNSDNILVTQEGYPVMGQDGEILLEDPAIRIDRNGQIFDDEENLVDTLTIVRFPENARMEKVSNTYFRPSGTEDAPLPAEECTVHQGALEGGNFTVMEEMTRMIDTLRAFEAYQKILQLISQQDSQITNKLAGT